MILHFCLLRKSRYDNRLSASTIDDLKGLIEIVNIGRIETAKHYGQCFATDNDPPPPSQYNQYKNWAIWQMKDTAIHCGRPPEKRGLELSILDDVFQKFREDAESPWPKTDAGNDAFQLASLLCQEMPQSYQNEAHRGKTFQSLVEKILSSSSHHWSPEVTIKRQGEGESRFARIDTIFAVKGITFVIQETKIELGEGHDVFMQLCRDYQIYVSSLREAHEDHREQGASTFLICLMGELIDCSVD